MFNFNKFTKDYKIIIPGGGNTAPGWINIRCPFCGDHSNHLGWNIEKQYFNCWHCGYHSTIDVIMKLLNYNFAEAKKILHLYLVGSNYKIKQEEKKATTQNLKIKFPVGMTDLKRSHREYLISRKFDPDYLIKKYDLRATSHIGDYKFRIIAPIYYHGKIVSFQGRDITNRQKLRYKACSKKLEVMHHKHVLYNIDNCLLSRVIVVEGITDVWRFGDNCLCTFGISYRPEQVLLLADRFDYIFILFDPEPKAQEKARKMAHELNILGRKTELIEIFKDDPGKFPQREAFKMKRELLC